MVNLKIPSLLLPLIFTVAIFSAGCICSSPGHRDLGADAWVLRYDATGTEIWKTALAGDDKNVLTMAEADDGGFIVAGGQVSRSDWSNTAWMARLGKTGTFEWNQTYSLNNDDKVTSVIPATSGIFAICYSGTLFKAGSDGTLLWTKPVTATRGWWSLSRTSKGLLAVAETNEMWFDETGNLSSMANGTLSTTRISAEAPNLSKDPINVSEPLVKTSDNGFVYATFRYGGHSGEERTGLVGKIAPLKLVKLDQSGNIQWITASDPGSYWYLWYFYYPEPVHREVVSVIQTQDGGYAVLVQTFKI